MPKELKTERNFNQAVDKYRENVGTERYQSLTSLLNRINYANVIFKEEIIIS